MLIVFFFNDPATTKIYTLSLHDALPIFVIESAAVLDESDEDQRVDDHIDFTGIDQDGDGTLDVVDQRVADAATPLVWGRDASGDPFTPRGFTNDDFFVPDAVLQQIGRAHV